MKRYVRPWTSAGQKAESSAAAFKRRRRQCFCCWMQNQKIEPLPNIPRMHLSVFQLIPASERLKQWPINDPSALSNLLSQNLFTKQCLEEILLFLYPAVVNIYVQNHSSATNQTYNIFVKSEINQTIPGIHQQLSSIFTTSRDKGHVTSVSSPDHHHLVPVDWSKSRSCWPWTGILRRETQLCAFV